MKRHLLALALLSGTALAHAAGADSLYTDLARDCRTEAAGGGEDPVRLCSAPDGYQVRISFAATGAYADIERPTRTDYQGPQLALADGERGKLEWRRRNGRVFAIIARGPRDTVGHQMLQVRGLAPASTLDARVDARLTDANRRARALADAAP